MWRVMCVSVCYTLSCSWWIMIEAKVTQRLMVKDGNTTDARP